MLKHVVVVMLLLGLSRVGHADDTAKIKSLEAQIAKLEARVKALEDKNAKYAEAFDFLQKVYDQQKQQQQAIDNDTPAPEAIWAVDITNSVKNGQVLGPANAPVTLVWAFDLNDRYSARMQPIIEDLVAAKKGAIRVVYMHMIVHPQTATLAHHLACAAGKQGKFPAFYRMWWKKNDFNKQHDKSDFEEDAIMAIAKEAGLDLKKAKTDMQSAACDEAIKADMDELLKFKVNATPTFYINGHFSAGAELKDPFTKRIDDALEEVAKSGVPAGSYYAKVVMAKGEKGFRAKGH